jgi:hypothetical protein
MVVACLGAYSLGPSVSREVIRHETENTVDDGRKAAEKAAATAASILKKSLEELNRR